MQGLRSRHRALKLMYGVRIWGVGVLELALTLRAPMTCTSYWGCLHHPLIWAKAFVRAGTWDPASSSYEQRHTTVATTVVLKGVPTAGLEVFQVPTCCMLLGTTQARIAIVRGRWEP